jgi:platelet-activating factor acetylhydrolase
MLLRSLRLSNRFPASGVRMTSYFSRLSPVPAFPEYSGPHKVGTIDVEIPVSELDSPSPAPDESISTVQFRIFYPCEPDAKGKNVNWIPKPQREYVSAYSRFLGAGSTLAEIIS